jgi:hypothetical protein
MQRLASAGQPSFPIFRIAVLSQMDQLINADCRGVSCFGRPIVHHFTGFLDSSEIRFMGLWKVPEDLDPFSRLARSAAPSPLHIKLQLTRRLFIDF